MANHELFQVMKTENQIINTLIENTMKMISERGWISKDAIDRIIEKHQKNITENLVFNVELGGGKKCIFMIVRKNITSMQKNYGISDLAQSHRGVPKIIIVKGMNEKIREAMISNEGVEVFMENELMINLVDHDLVPRHEVLGDEESETIYEQFRCTKRNLPKIFTGDPVARYYGMKAGQICRIIRPSEGTGYSEFYRLVVKKNVI